MWTTRAIVILAFFVIASVLIGSDASVAQQSRPQNNKIDLAQMPLENVLLEEDSIGELFSHLSFAYSVPIGLEIARGGDGPTFYRIELKQGTLSDLLTQFVTDHKEYVWEIDNGVVSIFPKKVYRDPVVRKLLETKISSFSVVEKTTTTTFGQSLLCTQEVKRILELYGITYDTGNPGGFYIQQLGQQYSFDVSNIPVKAILDKVIKESPAAKNWIISTKNSSPKLTLRVNAQLEYAQKP